MKPYINLEQDLSLNMIEVSFERVHAPLNSLYHVEKPHVAGRPSINDYCA